MASPWLEELICETQVAKATAQQMQNELESQKLTLDRRAQNALALRDEAEARLAILVHAKASMPEDAGSPSVHQLMMLAASLAGGSLIAWSICVFIALTLSPLFGAICGIPLTISASRTLRRFAASRHGGSYCE